MRNIALTLEYDGTAFAGSQFQSDARTVQGTLEDAWRRLTREEVRWSFAGRTDAGVHARGQVANARTTAEYPPRTVQRALNALLPPDVSVREVWEAPEEFHARFSAWRRDYRYLILNEPWPAPLLASRALHVPQPLDVEAMDQAVRHLVGEHDFAAFGAAPGVSTVRRCFEAQARAFEQDGRRIVAVELAANGFLRHMVRAVVGTLLLAGYGRQEPDNVVEIIASRDRAAAGPNAAAHGLYLEQVHYPAEYGRCSDNEIEDNHDERRKDFSYLAS